MFERICSKEYVRKNMFERICLKEYARLEHIYSNSIVPPSVFIPCWTAFVNFIKIFRAAFSDESVISSFSDLKLCVCIFLHKNTDIKKLHLIST